MSSTNWNDIFFYRDGKLYWKMRGRGIRFGKEAGSVNTSGYIVVMFNGKYYKAHRIIWEMHYGPIPEGMEVDHIWHNRKDNRIENLRLVTRIDNSRNKSRNKNNTSGVTGVNWNNQRSKWESSIKVNGNSVFLGLYSSFDDAVKARKEAERKYDFHPNHGVNLI